MRISHFETLKPVCPSCLAHRNQYNPLFLSQIIKESNENIQEGLLQCSGEDCLLEYPIIDFIPVIMPNIRQYISDNLYHITQRQDFSPTIESVLGDCAGPSTLFDITRQHISSYAWDHYGKFTNEFNSNKAQSQVGDSIVSCLNAGLTLVDEKKYSPILDVGCSVGRTTFELAEKYNGLVLGIDVSFSMLKIAQDILQTNCAQFPLRRVGIVYDRQTCQTNFSHREKVDFWACDALALPFEKKSIQLATALNILDAVAEPLTLLHSLDNLIQKEGALILATPYDWSSSATPLEAWLGGHSQRGENSGSAEPLLNTLLSPGAHPQSVNSLQVTGEVESHPWSIRIHDRSEMQYKVQIVAAKAVQ